MSCSSSDPEEEKKLSSGSMPYSSRLPLSLTETPVFLQHKSQRFGARACRRVDVDMARTVLEHQARRPAHFAPADCAAAPEDAVALWTGLEEILNFRC